MNTPLVSIVTPCYNGENLITTYLDSILDQTYPNIELILVDDGSTDGTAKVIDSYRTRFAEKKIPLEYIYQNRINQSAAINQGLKKAHGTYLVWPDSDDRLMPNSIAQRVEFLENNLEYGMVRSDRQYVEEHTERVFQTEHQTAPTNTNIFNDIFYERSYICSGCYMVRMEVFDRCNQDRHIEDYYGGQNYQMILPVAYNYRCGYIGEPLYEIHLHEGSDSHTQRDLRAALDRMDSLLNICASILNRIGVESPMAHKMIRKKKAMLYMCVYRKYGKILPYIIYRCINKLIGKAECTHEI